MTRGLFKSITLHFGILLVFLYGAEIFKQNKRFEIYEIPLEIVDVSDQTVNKTDKVKKKSKKSISKNQFFLPPKPKSKPNPPEFSIKEKQKKKKVNKIDQSPQQKKEKKNRMDSILKSIEKIKKDSQKTLEDEKKDDEKFEDEEEIKEVKLGEKLTISEKDAIRRQFYRCWIVPAGAKDLKKLVVSIRIKLNEDGEVVNTKLLTNSKLNNPFFRAASESAMRAVNHPECKKLQVPKKKYETWKEIILDFDPSQSLN
ncbi:MAG: hypothetical protein CMM92_02330 [Rickettsiales bacterium]|nr:hypothetical protein [Rickettsiales bacterium]RPG15037.1 MAG: hypothetical protein CBD55_002315 [Pelagibacteraceae bacterium TMED195]|tara:strand:- start:30 stop:797 length:768 start_codon:yes stop_codon:yes gene_type:complete